MKLSLHKEIHVLSKRLPAATNYQLKNIKVTSQNQIRICVCPSSGYWYGQALTFEVKTKDSYPHKPCKVFCKSKILHPNILELDGEVCLSIFDDDWMPTMRLEDYVQGILYLLHNPNFEDPLSDYFCIAREQGRIQDAINSISANNLIESTD